jgi:PAS domain S-box-containing protein
MKRESHVEEQPGREGVKVLLIEDNPGDMRLIRELLADFQKSDKDNPLFEIVWADNLHKGLELLASENIGALLLDLTLPDSRGYETFLKAKNRASNIPIIILTGLDDETLAVKALQDGAQDYLIKGQVDEKILGRAILYAMERMQLQEREEKSPIRILLVEDHEGDAKLISILLTESPFFIFDMTHVKNLKEAFNALDERRFDVILLDLLLPDSHGIETFSRIHEQAAEIPVIVITVLGDEKHAIQALRSGAQDYLVKGQKIDDLLARRIQYAIERHRLEKDRQIRNAEEVYRSLTIQSQSGIYIIQDGKMQFMNPYIIRNFGISEKDLSSMNILNMVHPEDREMLRINAIRMKKGESATPYEYRIIDHKRQVRWMMESVSSITYRGKRATLGNVMDITDLKLAEEMLKEREARYRSLFENNHAVMLLINPESAAIIDANPAACDYYGWPHEELTKMKVDEINTLTREEIFAEIQLARSEKRNHFFFKHRTAVGMIRDVEVYSGPIHIEGRSLLYSIVHDITDRKQAEEKLKDTLESLRNAYGTTIQVMVSAVESRDPYTSGHQIRSANLACVIATEMGLPPNIIDGIRMAGSIHDIGKLSVPAEILSKPTKLTNLEFSLIKEHAQKGYEMLKDVESPWPLAEIVYQHHERIDGSGYPRNLKGAEILMEARIMAVADVVESMASHRPYRPALGIEAALEEIGKNKGILYDVAVADTCLRLFREKGFQLEGV